MASGYPKVFRNGKLVSKSRAAPREGNYVISDTMRAMRHPITGKLMDSKSAFRAVTRAHGCVEIGNDMRVPTRTVDSAVNKADIAAAIRELGG